MSDKNKIESSLYGTPSGTGVIDTISEEGDSNDNVGKLIVYVNIQLKSKLALK